MSAKPHRINLSSVWEIGDEYVARQLSEIVADEFPLVAIRKFNRPTGLTESTEIDLTISDILANFNVEFNGRELETTTNTQPNFRCPITSLLAQYNSIRIKFSSIQDISRAKVSLEIHDSP